MRAVKKGEVGVKLPNKLLPVFAPPRGAVRYRGAYGGRGSAKSATFATMAAIFGYAEPLRILCAREFQNSIKESFYAELKTAINRYDWLAAGYDIGENYIKGLNGTEFLFKGLRRSMASIRSTHGIDICIIEEAEDVPEESYRELTPTIRAPGSEIWMIWNPLMRGSATDNRFRVRPPDNAVIAELNYGGNPWFPGVLESERLRDMELLDGNTYAHIWDGAYLDNSDRQVFGGKWRVEDFKPGDGWDGPYHGLDFGFSQDPTAGVKCWIHDDRLWIEREAVKVGLELDDTVQFLAAKIPGIADYEVPADNARPESISYLLRHGLKRVKSVSKWPGSVVDGIQHLRSYKEIVIHPRCEHARNEARLYSYKVDRKSGQVLPDIVDAHNHCLIGGTLVDTVDGQKRIDEMVGTTGMVWSDQDGELVQRKFHSVRRTSGREAVYKLTLSDGRSVSATAEHMMLTEHGWQPIMGIKAGTALVDHKNAMRYTIETQAKGRKRCQQSTSHTMESSSQGMMKPAITSTQVSGNGFTDMYGNWLTAQFLTAVMFTIETLINRITGSIIFNCLRQVITKSYIGTLTGKAGCASAVKILKKRAWQQKNGTAQRKAGSGIANTPSDRRQMLRQSPSFVKCVVPAFSGHPSTRESFAQTLVSRLQGESPELITFQGNALFVEPRLKQANTKKYLRAERVAEQFWPTVTVVEFIGHEAVYNLEVEETHTFCISGGIVSHNCWDAIRYALDGVIVQKSKYNLGKLMNG